MSDFGFKKLKVTTHQSKWRSNVFEVYKKASINLKWTQELKKTCKKYNIDFFTSPYDLNYVDEIYKDVCAYKIGSGDITWLDIIDKISKKKKPVLLASGASDFKDVDRAVNRVLRHNKKLCLMQCNTNYTGSKENINFVNLNVLDQFKKKYKNKVILGLSDHTFGHIAVLGAVAKGARIIEKHFTDNNLRNGPDHHFAMNPKSWKQMVNATRELEKTLGDGVKKIEKNEINAKLVQQRSIRAREPINKNEKITKKKLICLRPKSQNGLEPYFTRSLIGKKAKKNIIQHEEINWKKIK